MPEQLLSQPDVVGLQHEAISKSEGQAAFEEEIAQHKISVSKELREQALPYTFYFSIEQDLELLEAVPPKFYEEAASKYKLLVSEKIKAVENFKSQLRNDFFSQPYFIHAQELHFNGGRDLAATFAYDEWRRNKIEVLKAIAYQDWYSSFAYEQGEIRGSNPYLDETFESRVEVPAPTVAEINQINLRTIDFYFMNAADTFVRHGLNPDFSWVKNYPLYSEQIKERSKSFRIDVLRAIHDATPDKPFGGLGGQIFFRITIFAFSLGLTHGALFLADQVFAAGASGGVSSGIGGGSSYAVGEGTIYIPALNEVLLPSFSDFAVPTLVSETALTAPALAGAITVPTGVESEVSVPSDIDTVQEGLKQVVDTGQDVLQQNIDASMFQADVSSGFDFNIFQNALARRINSFFNSLIFQNVGRSNLMFGTRTKDDVSSGQAVSDSDKLILNKESEVFYNYVILFSIIGVIVLLVVFKFRR